MTNLTDLFDKETLEEAYAVSDLQNWLFGLNENNFEFVKKSLISSIFITSKERIIQLASHIIFTVSYRYMSISLYARLTRELYALKSPSNSLEYLKTAFFPIIVPRRIDSRTLFFLYFCMDGNLFSKYDIVLLIKQSLAREPDKISDIATLFCFFAPEVEELDHQLFTTFLQHITIEATEQFAAQYIKQFASEYSLLSNDNWYIHKQRREDMKSGNFIIDFLFTDSVEEFQKYISHDPNFDLNQMIGESIFSPPHMFMKTLIEFAARCGSIKCFKYLLLVGANLRGVVESAIIGGNNEIIRILNRNGNDFSSAINVAAKVHRNDIFKWLLNIGHPIEDPTNHRNVVFSAVESCNIHLILFLLEKGVNFNIRNMNI